jgi:hypothetical protein
MNTPSNTDKCTITINFYVPEQEPLTPNDCFNTTLETGFEPGDGYHVNPTPPYIEVDESGYVNIYFGDQMWYIVMNPEAITQIQEAVVARLRDNESKIDRTRMMWLRQLHRCYPNQMSMIMDFIDEVDDSGSETWLLYTHWDQVKGDYELWKSEHRTPNPEE